MLNEEYIKDFLEKEYDIPFDVQSPNYGKEPYYSVGPSSPGKELFTVGVSLKNTVRLNMEFFPQKYSIPFVKSMGMQPSESRKRFLYFKDLLLKKGAKCTIRINGETLDNHDVSRWPLDWCTVEIKATKMPISLDETLDYDKEILEWTSLFMGMILSLADIVPVEEKDTNNGYPEGAITRIEINKYERNPLNRKICLAANGYTCQICGFNFETAYGELGREYIHVHHIVPVSEMGENYIIDPIKELIPVCPNCHAMLHRRTPPIQPEELKKIMDEQNRKMRENKI